VAHELRSGEAQRLLLGHFVVSSGGTFRGACHQRLQKLVADLRTLFIDVFRPGEARRAGVRVGEINVAALRAEEARAAAHVRITDENVSRHIWAGRAALVGDDGADARIHDVAGDHAARVDDVRGEGVLVDDVVVHRAHHRDVLHHLRGLAEVLVSPALL
jgi:hypothetical protein